MLEQDIREKIFDTASDLYGDYLECAIEYGSYDVRTLKARSKFFGALEIIETIGDAELVNEFYMYYNERYL